MRYYLLIIMLLGWLLSDLATAQSGGTQLAAYESLPVQASGVNATFTKRPTQPGDRIDQQIEAQLDLESTVRRGQETIEQTNNKVGRLQKRAVIVDKVVDGKTVIARVRFGQYLRTLDDTTTPQPVVGNTYRCVREPDDTLSITKADGSFTTPDEYALVGECMDSLGRTNPLADFLAGRTLTVGTTVDVPQQVGNALISADGKMGEVTTFQLTLLGVDESRVARFKVLIETQGAETTQLKLSVRGELEVATDTCRTRAMQIAGPLVMATTIGSYSTAETTFVRGKLRIASRASYSE